MKNHLMLVKFGGSLITNKARPFTARTKRIAQLAHQMAEVRREYPEIDTIIGTGAGSFGHFTAHEYGLRDGAHSPRQYYGTALTHNAVLRLNLLVAQALTDQKLSAFVISPAAFISCRNGEAADVHEAPIQKLLELGCIPLVHGDTITDSTRGATILSTEKILQLCLEEFRTLYRKVTVVYLFDSEGILDEHRCVLRHITPDTPVVVHKTLLHDVSGGVEGKISSARKAAALADGVYLASGKTEDILRQILTGSALCTRVSI